MFQVGGAWFALDWEEELEKKSKFSSRSYVHTKYSHQTYTLLKSDNIRPTEHEDNILKLNLTRLLGNKNI